MNDLMESIYSLHLIKWSTAPWLILYFIAIFMMVYDRKNFSEDHKSLGISMWLMLLILYNPIVIRLFIPGFLSGGHDYSRMGWGGLTVSMIAFAVTVYATHAAQENKRNYGAILCATLLLILFAGEKTRPYMVSAENVYKIPNESIEIVELLDKYSTKEERPQAAFLHNLYEEDIQSPSEIGKIRIGIRSYSYKYLVPPIFPGKEEEYTDSEFMITGNGEDTDWLTEKGYAYIDSIGVCDVYGKNDLVENKKP